MIDKTLGFLVDELNRFLMARFPDTDPLAVLSSLSHMDGTPLPGLDRKLIVTLVNIGKEAAAPALGIPIRGEGGAYVRTAAPLHLNLYVMVSASFGNYAEGLKMLSCVLGFFQARPAFDPHNSVGFPAHLDKLSCELVSISTQELNNLWAVLGAKYLPSTLYKLRMVTLQQAWVDAIVPDVQQPDVRVGGLP
jgi:hypothetical protein